MNRLQHWISGSWSGCSSRKAWPIPRIWPPSAPGLGRFIRSLVGLDREAAKQALASFTQGRPLGANQIEFVDLIIGYLTENGFMDPALLYQSPFTDFDDQGAAGVFSLEDAKALVQLLKNVEQRVAA